jgi:SAM-dependent methyltransferase
MASLPFGVFLNSTYFAPRQVLSKLLLSKSLRNYKLSKFEYTGTDTLENLQVAVNYNSALTSLVNKHFNPDGKVLDYGAGIGTFSDRLRSQLDPTCLEIDHNHAEILKEKGYEVVNEVEKNRYDYIYSLNVLEHIENDREALEKLVQGLKPNGKILIFVPAFNLLFSALDEEVGHFRRYNKKMVKRLVSHPNVRVKSIKYFDSTGFFFTLVFKCLNFKMNKVNQRNIKIFDRFFFPINKLLDPLLNSFLGKNIYFVLEKKH